MRAAAFALLVCLLALNQLACSSETSKEAGATEDASVSADPGGGQLPADEGETPEDAGESGDPGSGEDAVPDESPPAPRETPEWVGLDPGLPGPFPVGVRTVVLDDEDRVLDGHGTIGTRRMLVEIWYPATDEIKGQDETPFDLRAEAPPDLLEKLGLATLPVVPSGGVRDAAPRKDDGPFPLVVFSHGNGGIRIQSVFLTRHLASHGYVVAAPDHTGDTLLDLVEAGEINTMDLLMSAADRPFDIRGVIDEMLRLSEAEEDPLFGLVDEERIAVSGHSFGGFTTFLLAAEGAWLADPRQGGLRMDIYDLRIKAAAPLSPNRAGIELLHTSLGRIGVPVLIAGGDKDDTLPYENHMAEAYKRCHPPKGLLTVINGGHFTFTDMCDFDLGDAAEAVGVEIDGVLGDGCAEGFADHDLARNATNRALTAFFDSVLWDEPSAAPAMDPAVDPKLDGIAKLEQEGLF